jgi:hypothetical protein
MISDELMRMLAASATRPTIARDHRPSLFQRAIVFEPCLGVVPKFIVPPRADGLTQIYKVF